MGVQAGTVLVVDDDEALAQIVALTLRAVGFEVRTACDGLEGYRSYLHEPTDWVVTDIQMPNLDGFAMTQRIRALNRGVKILYMSGSLDQFAALLQRENNHFGAQVLPKPFSRSALVGLMTGLREGLAQLS